LYVKVYLVIAQWFYSSCCADIQQQFSALEMIRILKEGVAGRTSVAWFYITDFKSPNFMFLIYGDVN
jgi:hypothetical protein